MEECAKYVKRRAVGVLGMIRDQSNKVRCLRLLNLLPANNKEHRVQAFGGIQEESDQGPPEYRVFTKSLCKSKVTGV